NTDAVTGCRRFLTRFYELAVSDKLTDIDSEEALKLGHRLVDGVTKDVEALQFNTAIAKMMEFMNEFTRLSAYPKSVVKMATQVLMPFAPHLAEEAWELLGCKEPLLTAPYPQVLEQYLQDATAIYVVQVNGKLRGKFDLPKDQPESVILDLAKKHPQVSKYLDGMAIGKVVFVPNKLLSIVTK
ncbi:MAG: class I tRNA ligase family protein, partial [Parachlamydiaceae bacterium]